MNLHDKLSTTGNDLMKVWVASLKVYSVGYLREVKPSKKQDRL